MKYLRLGAVVALSLLLIYYIENVQTTNNQDPESSKSELESVFSHSVILDYQQARSVFWQSVYPSTAVTLYCEEVFVTDQRAGFNVEHVFPMSWVTNSLNCGTRDQCRVSSRTFNLIEADLHNLYPSRSDVNQQRGSFAFGEINGEQRQFGKGCDFEVSEQLRLAEPTPAVRGEVARAMFYMAYQYREHGLKLFSKQQRLLKNWHQSDPPSDSERERNDRIEKLQGNRNLFIDEPEHLDSLIAQGYFS